MTYVHSYVRMYYILSVNVYNYLYMKVLCMLFTCMFVHMYLCITYVLNMCVCMYVYMFVCAFRMIL